MTLPDAASTPTGYGADRHVRTIDLTLHRDLPTFTIDSDTFSAPPLLSAVVLKRVAEQLMELSAGGAIDQLTQDVTKIPAALDAISKIMLTLMPGPSGRRFVERLNSDGEVDEATGEALVPPIDLLHQALPALLFLLECYGLRPTQPSSSSSTGSLDGSTPSDGTSSTDGVSLPGSESTTSAPPTSLT